MKTLISSNDMHTKQGQRAGIALRTRVRVGDMDIPFSANNVPSQDLGPDLEIPDARPQGPIVPPANCLLDCACTQVCKD